MQSARVLLVVVALVGLTACRHGDETGGEPPATTATEAREEPAPLDFERPETVVTGLEVPWGLAFLDEDTLLVTERPGRVRVVERGQLRDEPALELVVDATGEGGLLGLAVHPDYPDPPHVFLYHTAAEGNRVSRFTVSDGLRLRDENVVLAGIPAAPFHDGGALAFGPDGLLYIGTGDAGTPEAAADRASLAGKVLRFRPDGGAADGNPFPSGVYAYGLRNPQSFAWDADGRMYATDHGPSGEFGLCCHDELNAIEAGGFYGWPFRAGRVTAAEGAPPDDPVDPLAESGEATWAPAGIAVHGPEGAEPDVLVATLAGERLLRFPAQGDGVGRARVAADGYGRLRATAVGLDGCLYVGTSNQDGRGSAREGDDRLLRFCPGG